jgi:hypothetical protein
MKHYPLLIDFRGAVFGNGFVAAVSAHGRLLAVDEGHGDWWFYGVNPGAIAAHGDSFEEAHQEFGDALQAVLIQFATEAPSIDAFQAEAQKFFDATNTPTQAEWQTAVQRVRAEKEQLAGLPVKRADATPVQVSVTPLVAFTPEDNHPTVNAALAKAA